VIRNHTNQTSQGHKKEKGQYSEEGYIEEVAV
jgi:hypothetical protein